MKRFSSIKLLPLLLLVACGPAEPPPAVPDPAVATSAAPVEAAPELPDFPGVITSPTYEVVPAVFPGRIEKVHVNTRQRVKKGETVARLDPVDLVAQIDSLRAQESGAGAGAGAAAAAARSAANQAKAECTLYNRGYGSKNACTTATLKAAEARGQIGAAFGPAASARAQRKQLEEQVAKANLPAPIDGVVTVIKVKTGEMAQRGQAIVVVLDDKDLIIRFAVPKEHKHLLQIGGRVELRVASLEQPVWANINRITEVEPPISFFVVEADIDDSKLRPGELSVATEGRVKLVGIPKQVAVATPPPPAPQQQFSPPQTATAPSSPSAQAGANQ
jgi:multidrug efflux pump subunit AcrA (membrane-fusion protein)